MVDEKGESLISVNTSLSESVVSQDSKQLDSLYKPFPGFHEWAQVKLDMSRWEAYTEELRALDPSIDIFKRAIEFASRAAAAATGAIEGLYPADRGFTFTVAVEAATWEAEALAKGEDVPKLIRSQIDAYDHVLDFATKTAPIVEAWIRELHKDLTRHQKTYTALTEIGIQKLKLQHGRYKTSPNHVLTEEGHYHAYAPVDLTPAEMQRLTKDLESKAFLSAHPVIQAAFAHYSLVAIHPFADGNGRVARALASVFTYRSARVPVMILADERAIYYDALAAADAGDLEAFAAFMLESTLNSLKMVKESFERLNSPDPEEALDKILALYKTKGGYSHEDVDGAAVSLMRAFHEELAIAARSVERPERVSVSAAYGRYEYPSPSKYRSPIRGDATGVSITAQTYAPVGANQSYLFFVDVPRDCGVEDDIIIRENTGGIQSFGARVNELIPEPASAVRIRLRLFAQAIIGFMMERLLEQAQAQIRGPS